MLSSLDIKIIKQVSQNSFVFKHADRQIDRWTTAIATTTTTTINYYHDYKCRCNCATPYCTALRYWHLITLGYTNYTTLHLQLQLRYISLRYANYTTPHYNYNYSYNYTTLQPATLQLQLQLRDTILHPAIVSGVTTATTANNPPKETQLRPAFGPSVDCVCHPCVTRTHLSYSVLSLKLPPPPCAVLLVM